MTDMRLLDAHRLEHEGRVYACASGKGGIRQDKREGDGATPSGIHPLRQLFYRPDVYATAPETWIPSLPLTPEMGWCDAPEHPQYNRLVTLPFSSSHEKLWREDHVYDLILVLGYNDDPVVPGKGSAIFMHLARAHYEGTEGCVALAREDFVGLLARLAPDARLVVP